MIFKNLSVYLSQTRLDAVYDHICVFLVLFSDFREGVDPNLVVEGEGDQGLPILLCHLPGHPGELVARPVRPQGWQGIRCGCQEAGIELFFTVFMSIVYFLYCRCAQHLLHGRNWRSS